MSEIFRPVPHLDYLFVDLNSYFASVEQQENPELIGKPVAIVPMMTPSTCAIAASYEAKAFGIKTGTKIYDALKMCPDLICVLARHDVYVEYHHRIFNEIERHIHVSKICSIDEGACKLMKQDRPRDKAVALAYQIKRGIENNIGTAVKSSIGIAPNPFLAKIASDMKKPDGLTVLEPDNLKAPLCRLKLMDLTGININMQRRLNRASVYSVEDLWNISPKHARQIWNNVEGERFWYKLHGYDIPDRPTQQKRVIGHSRMLDPQHRQPEHSYMVTRYLLNKATARLRRYDLYTGNLYLSVRTPDRQRWANDRSFARTQDSFKLLQALESLWSAMLKDLRPFKLLKVSISLTDLEAENRITPDLFEDYISAQRPDHRLVHAMDNLNQKYGAQTVTIGTCPKTHAGYVGTKIAFNRIPELQEFNE